MNHIYAPKDYNRLKGCEGFSDKALDIHFKLYQGYVANANKLGSELKKLHKENATDTPQYAELKRRFGWEFNGMRLHELFFGNMRKDGSIIDKQSKFFSELEKEFDSFEKWKEDFSATGMIRGIGWVILYYDQASEGKRMSNVWINEHDAGHCVTMKPLLVMDMFEHAYLVDHDTKRGDYINAFFKNIDWQTVSRRFEKA